MSGRRHKEGDTPAPAGPEGALAVETRRTVLEVPDECGLHFLVKLCMIKVYFMPSVGAAACGKERLTMNAEIRQKYELWLQNAVEDPDLVRELRDIEGQEDAIEDRFYRELEFGTGGLRGVIGAGENRMNIYTVRKATQGLADYLNGRYETAAVSVSFDSRIKSDLFAREAARVLAANGITVRLFPELEPTPVLSYAVRQNRCQAGIMVTASHNPAKYNGYKCYGPDGCQMTDHDASEVTAYIRKVDLFRGVKTVPFDEALADGRIVTIADALLESYMDCVLSRQVNAGVCGRARLSVVYTPLNGTGNKPVREVLRRIGVPLVAVVPEQELPDGNFPTAPYPNPEIRQAFECALELAKTVGPDLLLATDPDCDRVGIAVRDGEDYTLMTGNEGTNYCSTDTYWQQSRGETWYYRGDSTDFAKNSWSRCRCHRTFTFVCQRDIWRYSGNPGRMLWGGSWQNQFVIFHGSSEGCFCKFACL